MINWVLYIIATLFFAGAIYDYGGLQGALAFCGVSMAVALICRLAQAAGFTLEFKDSD